MKMINKKTNFDFDFLCLFISKYIKKEEEMNGEDLNCICM